MATYWTWKFQRRKIFSVWVKRMYRYKASPLSLSLNCCIDTNANYVSHFRSPCSVRAKLRFNYVVRGGREGPWDRMKERPLWRCRVDNAMAQPERVSWCCPAAWPPPPPPPFPRPRKRRKSTTRQLIRRRKESWKGPDDHPFCLSSPVLTIFSLLGVLSSCWRIVAWRSWGRQGTDESLWKCEVE